MGLLDTKHNFRASVILLVGGNHSSLLFRTFFTSGRPD